MLIAVALLVIVVFQNLERSTVQLLFFTVELPQAAVLSVTLAVGFLLGLSAPALWRLNTRRSHPREPKRPNDEVTDDAVTTQSSRPTKQKFRRKAGVD
jgi:uncharacterized integral membrane protein